MKILMMATALAVGTAAYGQDSAPVPITIPLKGLVGGCCEAPVEQALGKIENVESVELRKAGSLYDANIVMREGDGLATSEIDKALKVANKNMGDRMGTTYAVDDSLSLSVVHLIKTKSEPDEAKLKDRLGKLKGFKSSWTAKVGFGIVFEGKKQATLADVKKAAGVEVTDVILAASKDGARYYCPMHPEDVNATAATCPICDMDMSKIAAGSAAATARKDPTEDRPKGGKQYTCPMCGGDYDGPGKCRKCGMSLVEKGKRKSGG